MIFTDIKICKYAADCYPWRETFAWFPIKTISNQRIWWKKIYKRKVVVFWPSGKLTWTVQYGTVFDLLNEPFEEYNEYIKKHCGNQFWYCQ